MRAEAGAPHLVLQRMAVRHTLAREQPRVEGVGELGEALADVLEEVLEVSRAPEEFAHLVQDALEVLSPGSPGGRLVGALQSTTSATKALRIVAHRNAPRPDLQCTVACGRPRGSPPGASDCL